MKLVCNKINYIKEIVFRFNVKCKEKNLHLDTYFLYYNMTIKINYKYGHLIFILNFKEWEII